MALTAALAQARDAYARRAWSDALGLLRCADQEAPLACEDLERLLWCAGMLDRDAELFAACERLFDACAAAGRDDEAAHWAFFHGFRLFALREHGRANAWMQRAQRHAERFGRECAAHGFLLLPQAMQALMAGDFAAAAAKAGQALAVGERCGSADLLAFARCLLGRARIREGRVDEGVALLDEAMLVAVSGAPSPVVTGLVYCNLIECCRQVYAVERAREWTQVLADWCHGQPQLVQFNGLCQLHRAEIFEMDGAWQQAVAVAREAMRSVARAVATETQARCRYQEAEIHRLRGEFAQAEVAYREASSLGMEPQPGLALLRTAQGQGQQAAATLRRVLAATADPLARVRLLPAYVEILLATGAHEEAAAAAAELDAIATRFATPILGAIAAHARGELALRSGDAAAALAPLRAAVQCWQDAQAPYIVARLRVLVGEACRAVGDEEGARLEFEAAQATFTRLGAGPDLLRLRSIGTGVAPPAQRLLTRREAEVLRLVASGKTNKRIALDLGLSEKTVDRHVSNIFVKLDAPSRAAATAIACRQGLL